MRPLRVLMIVAALVVPLRSQTTPGHRASAPPDEIAVTLGGRLTVADKGTYQEHRFDVPAGVTRIEVEFAYENRNAGTELEVGLFDPQRFRGTSRFSKQRFHITEFEATPSYFTGPLVPGPWRLSLGVPAIGQTQTTAWTAVVRMSRRPSPVEGLGAPLRSEPGWFAGDLHAHTLHSDGYGCQDAAVRGAGPEAVPERRRGCQPWEVVEAARARRLDFLAVTDHNTTSHHADLATLQEGLTTLLLLRGQELTTFRGHANVYGTSRPIDFRLGFHGRSMADVMDDVTGLRALLSINHPGRDTGDKCTGCGWDAPQTPWQRIEAMEVVNGNVVEGRTAGMPVWYARLNEGHHITGLGGGDEHGGGRPGNRIGAPATVIFAQELSEQALLAGIRSGRVHVRTRGPEGPAIDVDGSMHGQTVAMGGVVRAPVPGPLRLDIRLARAAGQTLEIVRSGEVVAALTVSGETDALSHTLTVEAGQWVHVRLRDATGITAFGNPVYVR